MTPMAAALTTALTHFIQTAEACGLRDDAPHGKQGGDPAGTAGQRREEDAGPMPPLPGGRHLSTGD